MTRRPTRRDLVRAGVFGAGMLAAWPLLAAACRRGARVGAGPLLPADGNGLRLPPSFRSRVVARSSREVSDASATLWLRTIHSARSR